MARIGILDVSENGATTMLRALVSSEGGMTDADSIALVRHPDEAEGCAAIVIPDPGAFPTLMQSLTNGLADALRQHVGGGGLLVGIGVGMQVLFDASDEAPGQQGLGLLAGRCERLSATMDVMTRRTTRIPHLGWNRLVLEPALDGRLALPMPQGAWVFFSQSFRVLPEDRSIVAATVEYGTGAIVAAVARDNVMGLQFRPERSGVVGLRILRAILARGLGVKG